MQVEYRYDIEHRAIVSNDRRVKSSVRLSRSSGPNLPRSFSVELVNKPRASYRSHFSTSCEVMSSMSANMSLISVVLKLGINKRSTGSSESCESITSMITYGQCPSSARLSWPKGRQYAASESLPTAHMPRTVNSPSPARARTNPRDPKRLLSNIWSLDTSPQSLAVFTTIHERP